MFYSWVSIIKRFPLEKLSHLIKRSWHFCQQKKRKHFKVKTLFEWYSCLFFFLLFIHLWDYCLFCSSIYFGVIYLKSFSWTSALVFLHITSDITTTSKQVGQRNIHCDEEVWCELCFSQGHSYFDEIPSSRPFGYLLLDVFYLDCTHLQFSQTIAETISSAHLFCQLGGVANFQAELR